MAGNEAITHNLLRLVTVAAVVVATVVVDAIIVGDFIVAVVTVDVIVAVSANVVSIGDDVGVGVDRF